MTEDERTDGGRFRPEHDDREYVRAVAEHDPAGTTEVAETVGVTRQNADQRLRGLEDDGRLTSKKVGNTLVWSLAADRPPVTSVDADDEFWDADTYAGEEMSAEDVDDVLYG
jgi:hypothetical protein